MTKFMTDKEVHDYMKQKAKNQKKGQTIRKETNKEVKRKVSPSKLAS